MGPDTPRPVQSDGRVHGVVAAVRDGDGRWLMVRRGRHVRIAPLKVCFPGGAVEVGESQEAAIVREMREELGIAVRPVRPVWRWDSPTSALTLWGWIAEMEDPTAPIVPDPREIDEVLWLAAEEGSGHPDGMPTNPLFIACLA